MVRSSFQLVKMMVKGGELRVQKYRIIFIIPHYRHRNLLVRRINFANTNNLHKQF